MFACSETCLTALGMAAGAALVAWAGWRENRWRKHHDMPLIPTTPVMFFGAVMALMALAHLLTLAGIHKP